MRSSRARALLTIVAIAALATATDRMRKRVTERVSHAQEASDVYPLPAPAQVQIAAVGYDEAVASVLWASLLYQYGDHVGKNRPFLYAPEYARTIVQLDPQMRQVYRFLSTFVTMQVKPPEVRELVEVRELLERGLETLPSEPDVWGAYATFMMFEASPNLPEEQRTRWRVLGSRAAERAVELGFRIDDLGYTGALLLERNGYRDLAIAQLRRAYAIAPNDETRAKIARKLERLRAANVVEALSRGFDAFRARWAERAPFVIESTFALIDSTRDVAACAGKAGLDPACDALAEPPPPPSR